MTDNNVVIPANGSNPGVVVTGAGHHGYGHRGLEGKDATFIGTSQLQSDLRNLTDGFGKDITSVSLAVERGRTDTERTTALTREVALIQSMEVKNMLIGGFKDNRFEMAQFAAEIKAAVGAEAALTRAAMVDGAAKANAVALQDAKDEILQLKIKLGAIP